MNRQRRQAIEKLRSQIETLKEDLELLQEQEQEAFDALSEGVQDSIKGGKMEEYIDKISDAVSDLDSAVDNLDLTD